VKDAFAKKFLVPGEIHCEEVANNIEDRLASG
jgi:hypothetical protein